MKIGAVLRTPHNKTLTPFPENCAQVMRILLQFARQRDFTSRLDKQIRWSSNFCFQFCIQTSEMTMENILKGIFSTQGGKNVHS